MAYVEPIIFVFGPSGVGKSYLSEKLQKNKFLYVHIDTDRRQRTFAANGFSSEWDEDYHKVDFAHFAGALRDRLDDEHAGAIVSFPTVHVFTPEKLVEAAQLGVTPLVLWGKYEDCVRAAEKRIKSKGKNFNLPRYEKRNKPAFRAYGCPEYDAFRVEAFREDGSRHPDEEWLARIMKRTAG
jgi:GTPase SAR1 family protein